jgi:hypothetical protein
MDHRIRSTEESSIEMEKEALQLLALIRADQEEADIQQTEPLGKPQQPGLGNE